MPLRGPLSIRCEPAFATLWGFDQCWSDYILQLDSDLLIGQLDRGHDWLRDMVGVFQSDPDAPFVPLSIFKANVAPYTFQGETGDWRVEMLGCMLKKDRLRSVLPVSNEAECGVSTCPHRLRPTYRRRPKDGQ